MERAFPRKPKSGLKSVIELAFKFQRLLDDGVVDNRAEVAKRYGISRARVTQVLNVLRLPQTVLCILQELAAYDPSPCTERRLRTILNLETEAEQVVALRRLQKTNQTPALS